MYQILLRHMNGLHGGLVVGPIGLCLRASAEASLPRSFWIPPPNRVQSYAKSSKPTSFSLRTFENLIHMKMTKRIIGKNITIFRLYLYNANDGEKPFLDYLNRGFHVRLLVIINVKCFQNPNVFH
jgi:hypothetical protein